MRKRYRLRTWVKVALIIGIVMAIISNYYVLKIAQKECTDLRGFKCNMQLTKDYIDGVVYEIDLEV